jgi:hypothetical protein
MRSARPTMTAPVLLLSAVSVPVASATLPAVALFLAAYLSRLSGAGDPNTTELATYVLPALVAYPVVGWLWLHLRRSGTGRWAWPLAALGIAIVIAVSVKPVAGFISLIYQQWQETQPGGRGYP